MNEEKLKQAVSLYKQGNKSQAANLLGEIVRQDPNNSVAWYGLALSIDEPDKKIYCLKKVISLDPTHEKAKQLLEKLQSEGNFSASNKQQTLKENDYQSPTQKPASKNFAKRYLTNQLVLKKNLSMFLLA
jgi:hypothetical protein